MPDGIVVKSTNLPEFQAGLKNKAVMSSKGVVDAINKGALLVHSAAVKSVQSNSGNYILYGKHWSSPPNSPPNTDTGHLVSNILLTTKATEASPVAFVISRANYSKWLELGTKNMEPRPFMEPALQKNIDVINKMVRAAIKKGLN